VVNDLSGPDVASYGNKYGYYGYGADAPAGEPAARR
jgi:hypothetical protein